MNVIVDTSVWSLALRRNTTPPSTQVHKLTVLIQEGETLHLLGVILQELLQGLKSSPQFAQLQKALEPFPILEPRREDYIEAAEIYNLCRSRGIQAETIDCFIAAMCIHHDCSLLTADRDFLHISGYVPLKLL